MNAVKNQDGVAMVEFALVLPLLLALVLGIFSFGFGFNYWIDETHLTREAARYAAVDFIPCEDASLQECIQQQADTLALRDGGTSSVADAAKLCIEYPVNTVTGTAAAVGDPVQATMSVDFDFIPYLSKGVNRFFEGTKIASIQIKSSATMRLETVPDDVGEGCA